MKASASLGWIASALFALLGGSSNATPSHSVTVTERLLGAEGNAYAVLRAEYDNCGSHYSSKTKVYFIERFSDGSAAEKSTLLSETETTVDASHNYTKTPPLVRRVISRDDSLSLAEILVRYPICESTVWDEAKLTRLISQPTYGISLGGRVEVASAAQIGKLFGGVPEGQEWKIGGAFEVGPCLFLSLEMEMPESGPDTRILGLNKELSDQVDAHLGREDIYLSAGTFSSREAALGQVETWKTTGKKQVSNVTWEVWSRRLPTNETDHVLVLTRTHEMLEGGSHKRIEGETGIKFEAITSERFVERTRVP